MPKHMEESLKKSAKKKGMNEEDADAYVYGTMQKKLGKSKSKKKGKK